MEPKADLIGRGTAPGRAAGSASRPLTRRRFPTAKWVLTLAVMKMPGFGRKPGFQSHKRKIDQIGGSLQGFARTTTPCIPYPLSPP